MAALRTFWLLLCVAGISVLGLEAKESKSRETLREKRSDDSAPLQAVVDNLAQQLGAVKAELTALQTQFTAHQAKLDTYGKEVAFHAWSTDSVVTTAPYGTIILPHLATNLGGGYDPQTGFFTAPVSGVYLFLANFLDHDVNDYLHAAIFVNGTRMAGTIADSRHGYHDTATISAVVHMTAGQRAQLRSDNSEVDNFYGTLHTAFSGVLIQAD